MIHEDDLEQIGGNEPDDEQDPRSVVLAFRDFLLLWDDSFAFFTTGTGKIGGVLHVEKQLVQEGRSLNDKLQALGEEQGKVKAAISKALVAIKGTLTQMQKAAAKKSGFDPEVFQAELRAAFPGIVREQMKGALALLEQISGAAMFNAYRSLCNSDLILDILTGELHRLDPVIGDLGCQWRAPFVMDLHDAVHEMLEDMYGESCETIINEAVLQYSQRREELPSCVRILELCAKSGTMRPSKSEPPVYVSKKIAPLHRQITQFARTLRKNAPAFTDVRDLVEAFMRMWLTEEIPDFNALEYIRLCKLLTANRIRTLDEFGLSGIQDDYGLPDEKRELSSRLGKLSNYSMAYMTYVCEQSCDFANLVPDEEGYALDPEDPARIHMVGSALKLMKDARFWTLQKSGFYKTNVCYGPTRAIFARQAQRGQPIIIDLRRLICTPDDNVEGGFRYTYNGGAILYFEPHGGRFVHVPGEQLTNRQRRKAGLVCEACSMVLVGGVAPSNEDPDHIFATLDFGEYMTAILENCHIVDLIMCGLSSHPELTTQIHLSDDGKTKLEDDQVIELVNGQYLKATGRSQMPVVETGQWSLIANDIPFPDGVTPDCDLLLEKARFLSILPKFKATSSQYKKPAPGDRTKALRNAQTMPFAPIHIYGSTFERKIQELIEAEAFIKSEEFKNEEHGLQLMTREQCRERKNQ